MPSKRSASDKQSPAPKQPKTRPSNTNHYAGYTPVGARAEVEQVSAGSITAERFYSRFVASRTPVVINGSVEHFPYDKLQNLLGTGVAEYLGCGEEKLQVERKVKGGYGSGTQRVKMSLEELVGKWETGDYNWYLTTQYNEDDPDVVDRLREEQEESESENESDTQFGPAADLSDFSDAGSIDLENLQDDFDGESEEQDEDEAPAILASDMPDGEALSSSEAASRLVELAQPPLSRVVRDGHIPLRPALLALLIPQQINLWMGCASAAEPLAVPEVITVDLLGRSVPGNGTSSGLHHDHADNLYVLLRGRKRFTLYLPKHALVMKTVGNIQQVYANGVIDYTPVPATGGVPYVWAPIREDGALVLAAAEYELARSQDMDPEVRRHLEAALEVPPADDSMFDQLLEKRDPPSFSTIPPVLIHLDEVDGSERAQLEAFARQHFPGLLELTKMEVWLDPGQQLYLPAGWFHEVTLVSSGSEPPYHMAVNYWFAPPVRADCSEPYGDRYWADDWERSRRAVEWCREHEVA